MPLSLLAFPAVVTHRGRINLSTPPVASELVVLGVSSGVLAAEHEPVAELVNLNDQLAERLHGLVPRGGVLLRLRVVLEVRVGEGTLACLQKRAKTAQVVGAQVQAGPVVWVALAR